MALENNSELDVWSHIETIEPKRKLVFLGASNLSRSFPTAISLALQSFEGPIDFYIAKGHGRSYGIEARCFGKKFLGIFYCGLWDAIAQENSVPINAWMTDIGNDLAYDVTVEQVMGWVEGCVDRLLEQNAQVVLSDLPIDVVRGMSRSRYRFFRTLLFPYCSLDHASMVSRAEQLSERIHELAKKRNIPVFEGESEWYGFDPIHPKRRFFVELWSRNIQLATSQDMPYVKDAMPLTLRWYLKTLQPEQWSFFSLLRRAAQPNGLLRDGTKLYLY